jgi:hypothetical protein
LVKSKLWQWAIFPGSYPPSIFAAGTFHVRVRDGNGWGHAALSPKKYPYDCINEVKGEESSVITKKIAFLNVTFNYHDSIFEFLIFKVRCDSFCVSQISLSIHNSLLTIHCFNVQIT